uniref:Uncharacterized protein n=1 Tax=viral metagenome TaxID=1070528 RepID=A0A6M3J1H2_9ZZZZ
MPTDDREVAAQRVRERLAGIPQDGPEKFDMTPEQAAKCDALEAQVGALAAKALNKLIGFTKREALLLSKADLDEVFRGSLVTASYDHEVGELRLVFDFECSAEEAPPVSRGNLPLNVPMEARLFPGVDKHQPTVTHRWIRSAS